MEFIEYLFYSILNYIIFLFNLFTVLSIINLLVEFLLGLENNYFIKKYYLDLAPEEQLQLFRKLCLIMAIIVGFLFLKLVITIIFCLIKALFFYIVKLLFSPF